MMRSTDPSASVCRRPGRAQSVASAALGLALGLGMATDAAAQFGGPAPVRVTEARGDVVSTTLELTGSVGSRDVSVVAAEVAGAVVELAAREGDSVERGAPLARLRRDTLELRLRGAQAGLQEARARLQLAAASLDRARSLRQDQVISQQQLDDAMSEHEAWLARVEQLAAEQARLERDLKLSTVRAPFSGVVVEERTAVGEWIDAGGAVAVLVADDRLEVTVQVPERYFAGVGRGAAAAVTFESQGGYAVDGTVRAVVPRADPQSRAFPVKISIPNPEGRIGVGMLARVRLEVGAGRDSVLVPKDALVEQQGSRVVFVVGDGDRAEAVPVTAGVARGVWVAVEGDLSPGARVVTRGNERLQSGAEVVPTPLEYPAP